MLYRLFIGMNLMIQVNDQNIVIDNSIQQLSVYKIKNEDKELTIWVRFQTKLMIQLGNSISNIPFAVINTETSQGQIIFMYRYANFLLDLMIQIPKSEYSQNLIQMRNYDQQTWLCILLFKNEQYNKVIMNNITLTLPQIKYEQKKYFSTLISWQNITFSLKGYLGQQKSIYPDIVQMKNDPIVGLFKEIIMNFKNEILIEMFLRKKSVNKNIILVIDDFYNDYLVTYGFSTIDVQITSQLNPNSNVGSKQFNNIIHNQWFNYKLYYETNKIITQINTFQGEFIWICEYKPQTYKFTIDIGLTIYFISQFIEIDNIIISNRLNLSNQTNYCFPGCKKCIQMECQECELNLNLSQQCSCEQFQFYNHSLQNCQDIQQYQGIVQNEQQVEICQLYQYYNNKLQKCMKCPRIDQYYCTDCVYNTKLWKENYICTFQEIHTNLFLNAEANNFDPYVNRYNIAFDQDYQQIVKKQCEFFQEDGLINCKYYDWDNLFLHICKYNNVLKRCNAQRGIFNKYQNDLMCSQGYTQIKTKCIKCPLNCVICENSSHKIYCLITKEGFYIVSNNSLIKPLKADNQDRLKKLYFQEVDWNLKENCAIKFNSFCLICNDDYILNGKMECLTGQSVSSYYNFEFFYPSFKKLSQIQLLQIVENQNYQINQSIFTQILFYGRQYENIVSQQNKDFNNNSFCDKYTKFNQTQKCVSYKNNFTNIQNDNLAYYCTNQKCSYNFSLNIIIYISNYQLVVHNSKSYNNIQQLLENLHHYLYVYEIMLISEVYVFNSFDQNCSNPSTFMIDDKFKTQFYPNTHFKLVLLFQTVSRYPICQVQNFYSNFEYIEIRNLQTSNKLLIQFISDSIKFIDCQFFNSQEIVISASYILFQNTSFFDFKTENTLIEIDNDNKLQEIQFISCNFFNISVEEQIIFINIISQVQKIYIKNVTIYQLKMFNSSFIQFSSFDIFQIQNMDIVELDIFFATIFSSERFVYKGYVNIFNIQIFHSSIYMSVLYMIDSQAEIKYLNLFDCEVQDSQLFVINNRMSLETVRIQELTLNKSQIFLFREEYSTMKLKDIQIQYSEFQATQSLIQIQAHKIILEQFIFVNCIYSPPMNVVNITAILGQIIFLTMKDINPNQEFIHSLPIYLFYLDVKNITIYHTNFQKISIYNIQLLYVLSDKAEISDFTLHNFYLFGTLEDSIIRLSLINQRSILKMERLNIINVIVKWLYQSSLIIILGNEGRQYINYVIIKDVLSILQHQIFQCQNTNLQIENVDAQLSNQIGFINQHHSKIKIKNYQQKNIVQNEFINKNLPIFSMIDYKNSDYELLAISESSFTYFSQPIMSLNQNVSVVIILKNVQIQQYNGYQDIFQFDVYHFSYESINLNKSIYYIYMERVLIIDINRIINFLDCQFCEVNLNKFQIIKTNLVILSQIFSRKVRIFNIYIQNTQINHQRYIFQFTDIYGYVFAQNIYIRNQSVSSIIFQFNEKINKITLKNIYINQCNNCTQLINFNHVGLYNNYYLENLFIMESQFNSDLIQIGHKYSQIITITNMFIYNSKLYSLIGNSQQKSMWFFNVLFLVNVSFDEQIEKEKVLFQNSYLLNATFNESQISIIDQKLFLSKYQQIIQKPITLTFNQQHFFNSTQLEENLYQVYFNNNQTFVYVPTGIPLSKFIYTNPKTKQQERIYDDFIIFLNFKTNDEMICSLRQSINDYQGNFSNKNEFNIKNGINIIDNFTFYMNPYLNYTFIQNDIICGNITLRFNVRTLPCQQGEYLYQNQCLICDITKNYYSVAFKAQFCNIIDNRIEQLKIGKIKIRPGYWRPKSDSNQIEQCQNEFCQGGWYTGDDSCQSGQVGALCIECDIYNKRGQGKYAKQNDGCKLCEFNYQIIVKGILISLWLMLLGYLSYNTNKQISFQYLVFKLAKRNLADILMRQSTNQISIILKIFTNYIFYLYLLQDKLDFIDYNINLSLDFISNPHSQLRPQLDCLLVQYHLLDLHYLQLIFSIISPFYTLLVLYFIYLFLLKLKIIQFQFNLIIITIYSVYLFNQQLIFENQIRLLSFTTVSNIKWINLNKQFQFNTKQHYHMIYYYILPSTILLILISVFILLILKTINKRSIKSTRYFGVLFTEYKVDLYYWEIFRIYQKYLILCVLYLFNQNIIFYLVQSYFAFMIFQQPYALKNLNYLEQKSLYILNSSLIIILILIDYSKPIRLIVFLIFNLFLTFDVLINLYQKARIQYKNQIIKGQQILIKKIPRASRWINLEKSIKLKQNMEILKNFYKSKMNSKNMQINWNKMNIKANFETLQTEIEMIDLKK